VRTATEAATVGRDAAAAVQAARTAPGQIATLILPSDTCWDEGGEASSPLPVPPTPLVDPATVDQIARLLRRGEKVLLVLGGAALRERPLADAHRIAQASGARLIAQTSNARIARGAGRHPIDRVPYPVDQALAALAGMQHVVLVGAAQPTAFFAYPGKPSRMTPPDAAIHVLARPEQDLPDALARLADALGAPEAAAPERAPPAGVARGAISPEAFARSLGALLPEQAVVIDESVTFGRGLFPATQAAAPHDWLQLTGGAIGDGLPLATGAAIGAPGRRVVSLQADGSAMYTIQALWTQARERLDVTTIIFSNRKYAILLHELANVGANPGRTALDMLDLSNPDLDFVRLANGMGVEAGRAETMEQFNDLFASANARRGPFVIELIA
jgi:acetolactate synthase-1/2/3 large subunit